MKRIITILISIIAFSSQAFADKISFTTSVPNTVVVGEQFNLAFTVTTQDVRDFKAPNFKGFEMQMGPSRSIRNRTVDINGKMISSSSITFTYVLQANKVGDYTIPGASIIADGNQMISNSVKVKVLPADQTNNGESKSGSSGRNSTSNEDIFVTATASKTNIYDQEAFVLTYKYYTQNPNIQLTDYRFPELKGFNSQVIDLSRNVTYTREHYKGRNYSVGTLRQFILFPQKTGKVTIEPANFEFAISKIIDSNDPIDDWFNGNSHTVIIRKKVSTPPITINVNSLPAGKPDNFSGGVGDLSISSSINSEAVKTNDAITVKLIISGTGNLKLITTPKVDFPEDFEIYDPKVDNQFRPSPEGYVGNKVIEYLAIPRHAGKYTIPGVTFSYFDLSSKSYKTLKTESYTVNVEKGEGNADQVIANFTNKEDLKVLGEDIRFINQNNAVVHPKGSFFYGTVPYWSVYIILTLAFIIFFIIYRKQAAENANVAKMKTKKANKVAIKRMKLAGKLLSEGKKDAFYDEVLKALWGYISDKLSIPVSRLSKENVEEKLRNYGVDDQLINDFLDALNNCEFARFAPGDDNQAMDKVYASSIAVISNMESSIKH